MPLTSFERLMLSNQFRILEKLEPEQAEMHRIRRDIVDGGFEGEYPTIFDVMSAPTSAEVCNEVMAILRMFTWMQEAYIELEKPDVVNPRELEFMGFDAKSEGAHFQYAQRLFQRDLFAKVQRTSGLDSQRPQLSVYRRMLAVRKRMESRTKASLVDLNQLLRARMPTPKRAGRAIESHHLRPARTKPKKR
jgi:uncharacterized protein